VKENVFKVGEANELPKWWSLERACPLSNPPGAVGMLLAPHWGRWRTLATSECGVYFYLTRDS